MPRAFKRLLPVIVLFASFVAPFGSLSALADDDEREYVVVDLGVLDGGEYSIGNAINSRGVVVGMALAAGNSQAVMLEDLQMSVLGSGSDASAANDINRSRQVVGFVSSRETSGQRATL
jgi:uncharacterized membrane protein